jgi:acyl-CoA synthetase (NDP forming)
MKSKSSSLGVIFEGVLAQEMIGGGVELILGAARDDSFGPTTLFGLGGTRTEILGDFSLAIGSLDESQALRLIEAFKFRPILEGFRGGPMIDKRKLAGVLSVFSSILEENDWIDGMEINPLIATEEAFIAVDVRVIAGRAAEKDRRHSESSPPPS